MTRCLGKHDAVPDPRVPGLETLMREEALPDRCNWYADVGRWPMFKNDEVSDCVVAGILHCIDQRLTYAGRPPRFTDADAMAIYETWGGYVPGVPETDRGMLMSTTMAQWLRDGVKIPSGLDTPTAYASIDHASLPWLKRAIWRCGGALIGIRCPSAWAVDDVYMLDFPDGKVGDVEGGHCMYAVGFQPEGDDDLIDVITWGGRLRSPWRALSLVMDEAYAILSRDWYDAAGHDPASVDWDTANAAMSQIAA